jgi:hypothetical protein
VNCNSVTCIREIGFPWSYANFIGTFQGNSEGHSFQQNFYNVDKNIAQMQSLSHANRDKVDIKILKIYVFVQTYAKRPFRVPKTGREIQFRGRCFLRRTKSVVYTLVTKSVNILEIVLAGPQTVGKIKPFRTV